jgi:hypothetical protein
LDNLLGIKSPQQGLFVLADAHQHRKISDLLSFIDPKAKANWCSIYLLNTLGPTRVASNQRVD